MSDTSRITDINDLIELQRTFAEIIQEPLLPSEKMKEDPRTGTFIAQNSSLSSHQRLELYAQQYWWRVIGSLSDDFPILGKILGRTRQRKLFERYLSAHPSQSYTLRHLGESLPNFILQHQELTEPQTHLCADTAKLELAILLVFSAEESLPIQQSDTEGSPSELYFDLKSALIPLHLRFPVHELVEQERLSREKGRGDTSNTIPIQKQATANDLSENLNIQERETYLVVHRYHDAVYFKPQQRLQYLLLRYLSEGNSLEKACTMIEQIACDFEQLDLNSTFQSWTRLGWLTPRRTS